MAAGRLGWSGFLLRWLFAAVLVFATYNPEGWSYSHWAFQELAAFNAVKALVGVVLIIGWTIYLRATFRSLGLLGLVLVSALLGTGVWALTQNGLISADSPRSLSYIVLVALSFALAIGISWSHVRRRLTGQVDADDVDEP